MIKSLKKLLAGLSLLASASAFAVPMTVDVTGIRSHGGLNDVGNTVLSLQVGANSTITGFSYNVNLTAFEPSYLSEIALGLDRSDFPAGFLLLPGSANPASGTATFTGVTDLIALGRSFQVGGDGILRLEFFELHDDVPGEADGIWNFGSITFEVDQAEPAAPVPEPASVLLLAGGLAVMAYAGRRRIAPTAMRRQSNDPSPA